MVTHAYWTWGAVLTEVGIFLSPLNDATGLLPWAGVVAAHSLACAIVAISCYALLPPRFRRPAPAVLLLLFCFAFIAPVLGAIGILLVTRYSLRRTRRRGRHAAPVAVALPEYDVQGHDAPRRGQSSIRSRLGGQVPGDMRMQALLTLQAVPGRVANPILEELLGDSVDDVRLLAFGMLDNEEKKISGHIQRERALLDGELSPEQRFECLTHLAELHWELIYAGLAQGALRQHILGQALDYLEQALALPLPPTAGMLFLKGRILLARGDHPGAQAAMQQALQAGLSPGSALPYLAEIAFVMRDVDLVRDYMEQASHLHLAPKTRAIADLWTGRDNVNRRGAYLYLPHL